MELTAYSPCPCGSGKKLKFCCQRIADEMERAERLSEGNQPHVALQHLEQLSRKHPNNPWIETTRAILHLNLDESSMSRDVLRGLLEHHPDHELAITLLAAATYQADGLFAAKRAIHRAFQRGARKYPVIISGLASSMAAFFLQAGRVMAAREHLALALRMAPEQRRQEEFVHLLELDGNDQFPYPLRGSHPLPVIPAPTEDLQKEIRKAQKYSAIGCWSIAGDLFEALSRTLPESAEVWQSVGLCRAWDGEEGLAAEALHRAAKLATDQAQAIECETLAQTLDQQSSPDRINMATWTGKVESMSLLLTRFDTQPRFERFERPRDDEGAMMAGNYRILDRLPWQGTDFSQLTLETLPRSIAAVALYDADPDAGEAAAVYLTGDVGQELEASKTLIDEAAGGLIQWSTEVEQPVVTASIPAELQIFRLRGAFPSATPPTFGRRLNKEHWDRVINELWPRQPLKALGGRTPLEAAANPELKTALYGAAYLFDANCQQHAYSPNLEAVLARLNLEPVPPIALDESTQLSLLSVMQTHRLSLDLLTDEQLVTVVNRAMLSRHMGFLYRVLKVALNRPGCEAEIDLKRCLRAMIDLCIALGNRDEALEWLEVARSKPHPDESDVEYQWSWDMTELGLRLEEPSDPKLQQLLDRFVHYYSPKLPQIRGHIERLLKVFGVPSPWDSPRVVSASGSTGVWTPGSAQPAASPSKLWLPGE